MSIKCVYLAGKLSDEAIKYLQNVSIMMDYADKLRYKGFSVFIPCLDLLMGIKFGYYDYEDYFDRGVEWLKRSDAIFVIPNSEDSKGTQREVEIANKFGIPIFYDIDKLFEAATQEE